MFQAVKDSMNFFGRVRGAGAASETVVHGKGVNAIRLRLADPIDDILSGRAANPVAHYNDRAEAILRRFRERSV